MNKKLLIGIICLVMVSVMIVGTMYNTKESAISAIQSVKSTGAVEADSIDITITSDKVCTIDYVTEEVINCHVCYTANYTDILIEECVSLVEGSSLVADNSVIKSDAQGKIQEIISNKNRQDVQYKERIMMGNTLKYEAQQMIEP